MRKSIQNFSVQKTGTAGNTYTIKYQPQVDTKVIKFQALDDGANSGYSTRILGVYVGQALQRPAPPAGGTLSVFFSPVSMGNAVNWDTCMKGLTIQIDVAFDADVTWYGNAVCEVVEDD